MSMARNDRSFFSRYCQGRSLWPSITRAWRWIRSPSSDTLTGSRGLAWSLASLLLASSWGRAGTGQEANTVRKATWRGTDSSKYFTTDLLWEVMNRAGTLSTPYCMARNVRGIRQIGVADPALARQQWGDGGWPLHTRERERRWERLPRTLSAPVGLP